MLLWINGWPDEFEPAMWTLQQFGMLFATLAVAAIAAIAGRRWTLAIPFVLVISLKLVVERMIAKLLVDRERLSYPSGHALTSFTIAVLLLAVLPSA